MVMTEYLYNNSNVLGILLKLYMVIHSYPRLTNKFEGMSSTVDRMFNHFSWERIVEKLIQKYANPSFRISP